MTFSIDKCMTHDHFDMNDQPKLKAFIHKRVPNKENAEDILQDVFYQLAKVDTLLNPIEQISAWLYKVARNMIINQGTKKREEELPHYYDQEKDEDVLKDLSELLLSAETSPSSETAYLRSLVWTELEIALAELPLEQSEVYMKTELDGFSIKEISAQTGVPANTLLSRKHYATLHLRKRLTALYEELIGK